MVLLAFLEQAFFCRALQKVSFSLCRVLQAALLICEEGRKVETDELDTFQREDEKPRKTTPFCEILFETGAALAGGHYRHTRRLCPHAMVFERVSRRRSIATMKAQLVGEARLE